MKFGISVEEIMQRNFPIVDCKERVTKCVSIMRKDSACLVIKNGNFQGILSKKEIMDDFLNGLETVNQGKIKEEIGIIEAESDISDLVALMKEENLEFVIVKKNSNIIGIASRKDLRNLSLYPKLEKTLASLNQVTLR